MCRVRKSQSFNERLDPILFIVKKGTADTSLSKASNSVTKVTRSKIPFLASTISSEGIGSSVVVLVVSQEAVEYVLN